MIVDMPGVIRRNATSNLYLDVGKEAQTDQFHTLVLEDDRISQAMITQAIFRAVPDGLVLSARTLAEGRELLTEYEFHFCVLDIQLPDGIGIDFLHDIQTKSPNASLVILTAQPLPEYRDQAEAFGVLHFMEKTANLRVLGAHARNQWERTYGAKAGSGTGFSASLTRLTTLDLIQIKCLGGATVALDFASRHGHHGQIFFKDGEIIHAETPARRGVEAFNEIVSWREGRVTELTDTPEPERTIQGNWQGLLMHAVHWADEHRQ
jgi:DNA-binding response OmpR family regulator